MSLAARPAHADELLFDIKVKTFFKKIIGQEQRLDPAVTPTLSIST